MTRRPTPEQIGAVVCALLAWAGIVGAVATLLREAGTGDALLWAGGALAVAILGMWFAHHD